MPCAQLSVDTAANALISAELLSALTRRQAACAVNGFPDHDVHVVVTCRDVGRVLVSAVATRDQVRAHFHLARIRGGGAGSR